MVKFSSKEVDNEGTDRDSGYSSDGSDVAMTEATGECYAIEVKWIWTAGAAELQR